MHSFFLNPSGKAVVEELAISSARCARLDPTLRQALVTYDVYQNKGCKHCGGAKSQPPTCDSFVAVITVGYATKI